jgi:hypothetical protein
MKLFKLLRPGDKAAIAKREAAERAKARPKSPNAVADPVALRDPSRQDPTLKPHTVAWAERLPAALRPNELMRRYPRVANRLALCWNDPVLTNRLLEDLLVDRRGGRQGFPAPIRSELIRIRVDYPKVRLELDTRPRSIWDPHEQAPSDR